MGVGVVVGVGWGEGWVGVGWEWGGVWGVGWVGVGWSGSEGWGEMGWGRRDGNYNVVSNFNTILTTVKL